MQILVVEDENRMRELLGQSLAEEGHTVAVASNGAEALARAFTASFDVIALDVMLPGQDGFAVAQRLREGGNRTPILFLTARDNLRDKIMGLDLGGDDYMTKPFAFGELLARLRALGRRGPVVQAVRLEVDDLILDTTAHKVTRSGEVVHLTPTEYSLLELLMRRTGRVATRSAILSAVWGFQHQVEPNTLDAFVRLLRSKVDSGAARKLIHTVHGVGYCLEPRQE